MKQLVSIMGTGFGRYPSASEIDAMKKQATPEEQVRLDLVSRVAAVAEPIIQAVNEKSCEILGKSRPVYNTAAGRAAGANDSRILLRFATLAAATEDYHNFAIQIRTWYVDFMGTVKIPLKDIYLNMTYLGQALEGPLDAASAAAIRRAIQVGMTVVEKAMLQETASTTA